MIEFNVKEEEAKYDAGQLIVRDPVIELMAKPMPSEKPADQYFEDDGDDNELISDSPVQPVKAANDILTEAELWREYDQVKTERNKLSSQIWKMVQNGADTEELRDHYTKIESFRPTLVDLWMKIEGLKKTGKLPEPKKELAPDSSNILELKDQKRKVVDKRSKLQRKIKEAMGNAVDAPNGAPIKPNSTMLQKWQLELDQANAEYVALSEQIRKAK
jgi:hypothetical protein